MDKPLRITDWAVVPYYGNQPADGYKAPEQCSYHLKGLVENHPRKGTKVVRTSSIIKTEGRLVWTSSGSVYRLGRIHAEYRQWLKENNRVYNPKQPITIFKDSDEDSFEPLN